MGGVCDVLPSAGSYWPLLMCPAKGQDGVLIRTFILVIKRVNFYLNLIKRVIKRVKNFVMTCFKYLFAT